MTADYVKVSGYAWVIVAATFLVNVITDGLAYSSGILFVELIDVFGESRGYTGTVGALLMGTMHLIGPVVSALTKRISIRVIVVLGSLLASVGVATSYLATNVILLCITFSVLGGTGFGMMYVPASLCVLQSFDKHLVLANGLSVCGSGVGTVVFTQVLPILFDMYGLRGTMLILSGIVLNGIVLGMLLPPVTAVDKEHIQSSRKDITWSRDQSSCPNETVPIEGDISLVRNRPENNLSSANGDIVAVRQIKLTDDGIRPTQEDVYNIKTNEVNPVKKMPMDNTNTDFTNAYNSIYFKVCGFICNQMLVRDIKFWLFMSSIFLFVFAVCCVIILLPDQAELGGMSKFQASWLVSVIGK